MQVKHKVIIVTGAGSGMGRELTLNLLKKGAKVAAIDINNESLRETASICAATNEDIKTYILDVSQKEEVDHVISKIKSDFGVIDGIINNAGIIQPFIKVESLEMKDIERVMNINFYGTVYLIKAVLPILLTRPVGHIVNISSMGGFLPVPGQTVYGASKAAVKLLTEGLYSELKDTNVQVTVVFPGAIETNITKNSGVSTPGSGDQEQSSFKALPANKAAEIIINGIQKDKFRVTVGSDAGFLDKLYRFFPKFATNFIQKKMKSLLK